MSDLDSPDDLDRLFVHLERASAPPDLTARVLASTVQQDARGVLIWPWLLVSVAALVGLSIAGYLLGASLATSDGLDVVQAVGADLSLLAVDPGDVLAALGEVLPWPLVALAAFSAALLTWASGRVLATRRPQALG